MKTYSLILLTAGLLLGIGQAGLPADLVLEPGELEGMVRQLEGFCTKANMKAELPIVVYAPDVPQLTVDAPLRLGEVRPVDALALIAAAAGCELEPIHAPEQTGDDSEERIIGYRFVRQPPRENTGAQSGGGFGGGEPQVLPQPPASPGEPQLVGVGLALSRQDGYTVVGEVIPGTAAAKDGAIQVGDKVLAVENEGTQPVPLANVPLEKVVSLIRGAPGSPVKLTVVTGAGPYAHTRVVRLLREPLPVSVGLGQGIPVRKVGPGEPPLPNAAVPSTGILPDLGSGSAGAAENARVETVRIFALGSLLNGTEEETKQKQDALSLLVAEALELANGAGMDKPVLSFHAKTGALIVRGTEAQHAVVEQALAALKENKNAASLPAQQPVKSN